MDNKIKELRKLLGITQYDLAKSIGVSRQYLSDVENMKKQPTIKIAFDIALRVGVKVDELFYTKDDMCYSEI